MITLKCPTVTKDPNFNICVTKESPFQKIKHATKDYDDVIKGKPFPCYWPFVRLIHRSPVNSSLKGQWRGVLMCSLISAWANGWVNNRNAGDLRRHRAHYNFIIMTTRGPLLSRGQVWLEVKVVRITVSCLVWWIILITATWLPYLSMFCLPLSITPWLSLCSLTY